MRHILWLTVVLIASVSQAQYRHWRSQSDSSGTTAQQGPQPVPPSLPQVANPTDAYDGLDPSKISPELKLYFDAGESYRQELEGRVRKLVSEIQSVVSLKEEADNAHRASAEKEAELKKGLEALPDYQQAESDLGSAQAVLDNPSATMDQRIPAAQLKQDAKRR